jgi:hypothetical protein
VRKYVIFLVSVLLLILAGSGALSIFEDFEDGNIDGWTGSTSNLEANSTSSFVIKGSYSGEFGAGTSSEVLYELYSSNEKSSEVSLWVYNNDYGDSADTWDFENSTGSRVIGITTRRNLATGESIHWRSPGGTSTNLASTDVSNGNWYKVNVSLNWNDYLANATVQDESETIISHNTDLPFNANSSTGFNTFRMGDFQDGVAGVDNLKVESFGNVAPGLENPYPSDGASEVSNITNFSIDYSDSEGDQGNVTFMWKNGTHIQTNTFVSDGSTTRTSDLDLKLGKSYDWQVNASDNGGGGETFRGNYSFTVESADTGGIDHGVTCESAWYFNESSSPSVDFCGSDDASWNGDVTSGEGVVLEGQGIWNDGKGFSGDGDGDYMNAGTSSEIKTDQDFTFSAWFRTSSDSNFDSIISKRDSSNSGINFRVDESRSGSLWVQNYDGTNGASVKTSSAVDDNKLRHMTVTWDESATEICLYVNNSKAGCESSSKVGNSSAVNGEVIIGMRGAGGQNGIDSNNLDFAFKGMLDEIRWYNQLLSSNERKRLYLYNNLDAENSSKTKDTSGPVYESTSTSPSNFTYNQYVDVSGTVNDTGGKITEVCADVLEAKIRIVKNNCKTFNSETVSFTFTDLFNASRPRITYDVVLTAKDNASKKKNEKITQFNEDYLSEYFNASAGDSPTYGIQNPIAEYESSVDKTFMTICGKSVDPYATSYDHATGRWGSYTKAGTQPESDEDYHYCPALTVDDQGYINIFYGDHGASGKMKHARSNEPYDVSNFTVQSDPFSEQSTYPSPLTIDGTTYLTYRRDADSTRPWGLVNTTDTGSGSWSSPENIIDFSDGNAFWIYVGKVLPRQGNISMVWYERDKSTDGAYLDIFYAEYDPESETIYSVSGNSFGSEISESEARGNNDIQVFDSLGVGQPRFDFDQQGDPHVIFPNNDSGNWRYQYVRWNGTHWDDNGTISAGNCHFASGDINVNSESDIEVLLTEAVPSCPAGNGGNMTKYTYNGVEWSQSKKLVAHTNTNLPKQTLDYDSELKWVFAERDGDGTANNDVYAYGDNGFVYKNNAPNSPPSVSSVSASPDPVDAGNTVNVTATITDSDGNLGTGQLINFTAPNGSVMIENAALKNASQVDKFYTSLETSVGDEAEWSYSIEANDTQGATGTASGTFNVSDVTPPSLTVGSPENKTYTDQTTIDLNVTGSDNHAGISNWYYNRDAGGEQGFTPNTSLTYTEGQHNLTIKAEDGNSNNQTDTVYFYVNVTLPDGYVEKISSGKHASLRSSPSTNMSDSANSVQGVQDLVFGNSLGKNLSGQLRVNLSASNLSAQHLVADTNRTTKKSVLANTSSITSNTIEEKTLLIPRESDTGKVHICPNAENLSESELGCGNGYNVSSGNTVNGVTVSEVTINSQDYYEAAGVNGTGGLEVESSSSDGGGSGGGSSGGGSSGGGSTGGSTGGGSTGSSGPTIVFDNPSYSLTPGQTHTKTVTVENTAQEQDTVDVHAPQSDPACSLFRVETGIDTNEYGIQGSYSLNSAFSNNQSYTASFNVRVEMPGRDRLKEIGGNSTTVSCTFDTEADNGEAGNLTVKVEPGGIASQFQDAVNLDLPELKLPTICLNTKNTSTGRASCPGWNNVDLDIGPTAQVAGGAIVAFAGTVVVLYLFGQRILSALGAVFSKIV